MTTDDVMKGSTTFTMLSTTSAFRENNPKATQAVLAAFREANGMIGGDSGNGRQRSSGIHGGRVASRCRICQEVVEDPAVKFTTTPENVMKYAEFMHRIGTLEHLPASWQELFFADIHGAPGS